MNAERIDCLTHSRSLEAEVRWKMWVCARLAGEARQPERRLVAFHILKYLRSLTTSLKAFEEYKASQDETTPIDDMNRFCLSSPTLQHLS